MQPTIEPEEPAQIVTTVVIPVWGAYAEWLPDAVSSLRAQEVPVRIVVIDNASEGSVPDVAGVEVIRVPDRISLGAARNFGLAQVRTPYVVFWDADDVAVPGAFSCLEQAISDDSGLVAFGMAIQEASGERHRWPRRWLIRMIRFRRSLAILHAMWSTFPTTGATIIRTAAARDGGGFSDSDSGDDWCLGVSLAFRGRLGWTEQPGRVYHLHAGSVWSSYFTLRHQSRHARIVRQRLREDPGVPAWAKLLIPAIWLGQVIALAAHAIVSRARRPGPGSDRGPAGPA